MIRAIWQAAKELWQLAEPGILVALVWLVLLVGFMAAFYVVHAFGWFALFMVAAFIILAGLI